MEINDGKKILSYIFIAYLFSLAVHLIWVYLFWGYEPFIWNGQFMINTNDGYYWAEGARDVIAGYHQENDLSPVESAPAILTAFFYKILPFSFETIIFYMSAFLSSLVVIPIILIGKSLKNIEFGFVAALLASIAWSYYNRTLVGYYDTDMLNILFPALLLWSLILALRSQKDEYLLFTALEIIAYRAWYPQSYALEFSFFALLGIYALYLWRKKEDISYLVTLMTFMMLAMINLNGWLRIVVVVTFFITYKKELLKNYLSYLFGISILLFFLTGGFDPIWGKLKAYVFRDTIAATKDSIELHFFTVMQTIREAGSIPFTTFANRISGHIATFILSLIGYIWLLWRYPVMLLTLPLLGLGFLAYSSGLRFTIYAIIPLAFGIAFLIFEIAKFFQITLFRRVFIVAASLLILAPNIYHAYEYRVPTVFVKPEVAVLDKLKSLASREDYVVAWWDYGYPIRYYSDVKTLIDGGKHEGDVNFAVSFALTHDQVRAAKLARLDVEYTERKFKLLDEKKIKKDSIEYNRSNIAQMMVDNNFSDPNDFLDALSLDTITIPKKTRDIYFYLPNRMMEIFPTVAKFSYLDLKSGSLYKEPLFLPTQPIKQKGSQLALLYQNRYQFLLDLKSGSVKIGKKIYKIKNFIITQYDKAQKLHTQTQGIHFDGDINVIYMKNYNRVLLLDDTMLHSSYIELFVLEKYNPNYFQPVILTPLAKVYKLQR